MESMVKNKVIEERLICRTCSCGKSMQPHKTKSENGKVCTKYICPQGHSNFFSLSSESSQNIILTLEQYEDLNKGIQQVQKILKSAKRKQNQKQ